MDIKFESNSVLFIFNMTTEGHQSDNRGCYTSDLGQSKRNQMTSGLFHSPEHQRGKKGENTTLSLSTETEAGEARLIPVQPSLKTACLTRVHSKHIGDKLHSNSHLSISHLTGLFTC